MPSYKLSTQPTLIARLDVAQKVSMRVVGAGTMLLAQELGDAQSGVGIQIVAGDGPRELTWAGEMWATCDDPQTINQFIFTERRGAIIASENIQSTDEISAISTWDKLGAWARKLFRRPTSKPSDDALSRIAGGSWPFALALACVLLGSQAQAQIDVVVPPSPNAVTILGRSLNWSTDLGSSPFTQLKRFIYTPLPNSSSVCFYIYNNNPTNAHAFSFTAFGTNDNTVNSFISSAKWTQLSSFPISNATLSIAANTAGATTAVQVITARTQGSVKVTLQVYNGVAQAGSPDTADIIATSSPGDCGATPTYSSSTGFVPGVACDKSISIILLAGVGNAQLVIPKAAGKQTYICSYLVSDYQTDPATTNIVAFFYGTGAVCGTGTTNIWSVGISKVAPSAVVQGSGLGQLFTIPQGQDFCTVNTTDVSVINSFTYAQF